MVTIVFTVIRENNQPFKTIAWIEILAFLPVIGFFLYIFFGINYRKRKMFKKKAKLKLPKLDKLDSLKAKIEIDKNYSELKIMQLLHNTDKSELTVFNNVTPYHSGKDAIISLFSAIEKAEKNINLEYFSISNDQTGRKLLELLTSKQKEGVQVRLIYDAVGCWKLPKSFFKPLKNAGGKITAFLPVKLPILSSKLNYRNHRKIAIIDGRTAFIGGVNIGDKYYGLSKRYGNWRDTHIKIEGEAVYSLQKAFFRDWFYYANGDIEMNDFFPKVSMNNNFPIQIVASGADSDWENIMLAYFSALTNANSHIYIITPYLVLNESILTALKTASLSGLDVRIILPNRGDHWIVFWGSRSYYEELLHAGVKIYEYKNGFPHAKMILVDDLFVSIGSANMDIRSFSEDLEINALLYDKNFALKIKNQFITDFSNSVQVDIEEYKKRKISYKAIESVCRLFSPLL